MRKPGEHTFPDSYKDIPTKLLLKTYSLGPKRIGTSIEELNEKELKARVIESKWTIFEILLHVVDSEIAGAVRIRQCYSQSDTRFPFYNQDIWADKFNYQNQSMEDLKQAMLLFKNLRVTTFNIFENCLEEDWQKTGFHPKSGNITLRNLLELYADHSERHIEQIKERRKLLEKPLELPMILEERLY